MRGDCTVIETHIHKPHDSGQLWDCVSVVTRTSVKLQQGIRNKTLKFHDHRRRAKKRYYTIVNTTKAEDRKKAYRDMLHITDKTYRYGMEALNLLVSLSLEDEKIEGYITRLVETL